MADDLCGPANALQSFKQQINQDKSLQRDRQAPSPSGAQGFHEHQNSNGESANRQVEEFLIGRERTALNTDFKPALRVSEAPYRHRHPIPSPQFISPYSPPSLQPYSQQQENHSFWIQEYQSWTPTHPYSPSNLTLQSTASRQNPAEYRTYSSPLASTPQSHTATTTPHGNFYNNISQGFESRAPSSLARSAAPTPPQHQSQSISTPDENSALFEHAFETVEASFSRSRVGPPTDWQTAASAGPISSSQKLPEPTTLPVSSELERAMAELSMQPRIGADTIRECTHPSENALATAQMASDMSEAYRRAQQQMRYNPRFRQSKFFEFLRQVKDGEVFLTEEEVLPRGGNRSASEQGLVSRYHPEGWDATGERARGQKAETNGNHGAGLRISGSHILAGAVEPKRDLTPGRTDGRNDGFEERGALYAERELNDYGEEGEPRAEQVESSGDTNVDHSLFHDALEHPE